MLYANNIKTEVIISTKWWLVVLLYNYETAFIIYFYINIIENLTNVIQFVIVI